MTATSITKRTVRPTHSEATTHLFAIGQTVRLTGGYGIYTSRLGDIYHVTGTLPPSGNSFQYRIRSDREQHERVVTEDSLEPVVATQPGEGAALVDRTFGR